MYVHRRGPYWSQRFDCKRCKSDLHVEISDVKADPHEEGRFFFIICPVCEGRMALELNQKDVEAFDAYNTIKHR